jgi:hypothetical protein
VKTDAVEHGLDADAIEARERARSFVQRPEQDVVHVRVFGALAGDHRGPQALGPLQLLEPLVVSPQLTLPMEQG